jgi:DNA-3-methyladenine glycosylase I
VKVNLIRRCDWVPLGDPLYIAYHDLEWGVPLHEDSRLFELLILEGMQAGLSWRTILQKRENFRKAFDSFDPRKVARYEERKVKRLLADVYIIRNGLKIRSAITNAKAFLAIQREFGSFDFYIWGFNENRPRISRWQNLKELPAATEESRTISEDLIKRGFHFVGPTTIYSFMQAAGMVNDHLVHCFRYRELARGSWSSTQNHQD